MDDEFHDWVRRLEWRVVGGLSRIRSHDGLCVEFRTEDPVAFEEEWLTILTPWRIEGFEGIILSTTHESEPTEDVSKRLRGRKVNSVEICPDTADLTIRIDSGYSLRCFNDTPYFECWSLYSPASNFRVDGYGDGQIRRTL